MLTRRSSGPTFPQGRAREGAESRGGPGIFKKLELFFQSVLRNALSSSAANTSTTARTLGDTEQHNDHISDEATAFRNITGEDLPPWLASPTLPLQDCLNRFYTSHSADYTTAPSQAAARGQKRPRDVLDTNEAHLEDTDSGRPPRKLTDIDQPPRKLADDDQPPRKLTDDDQPPRKRQPTQTTTVEGDDKDEDGSADENEDTGTIHEGAEEAVLWSISLDNNLTAHAEELMEDDLAGTSTPTADGTSPPLTSNELFELFSTRELQAFLNKLHTPQLARDQRTPKSSPVSSLYKDPDSPRKFSSDVECFLFKQIQEALRMAQPELDAADMNHFHGSLERSKTIAMMHYPTSATATNGKYQSIADLSNPCIRWLADKFDLADMFLFD
ncbi:hypothetical protein LTR27_004805 [Elasticomyces elasticus]|nr:hypothetical protein LTR27_004805 [Elasticomyces elasticus]